MAIRKVRIRPEGGNNYADVLHPETSADIVIESENKMFVSNAEKNKLAGIEEGANKTIINNTLTSTSTTQALSASQGKILKDDLDEHKAENITTHNVSRGISNFAGNGLETTIPHGLPATPVSAYAFPTENPEGYLGEVWIRMDETNIYVGNSGSFTGEMSWVAIG